MTNKINYPYLPTGKKIEYVTLDNKFMKIARNFALSNLINKSLPITGSVITKEDKVLGFGASGGEYHKKIGCERVKQGCPPNQGYELCEGCQYKNHSEQVAIRDAYKKGNYIQNADLYLWGQWWSCKSCWQEMINAGIKNVFLLENSEILFNRENPNNIIGKHFDK